MTIARHLPVTAQFVALLLPKIPSLVVSYSKLESIIDYETVVMVLTKAVVLSFFPKNINMKYSFLCEPILLNRCCNAMGTSFIDVKM